MKKTTVIVGLVAVVITIILILMLSRETHTSHATGTSHNMTITSEEQFIFEMVPHHQEAVDTATQIAARTENPELLILTQEIVSAQTREIAIMEQWKREWFSTSTYSSTYMNMMPPLERLSGDEADRAFLKGMIAHHQMAIAMAQQVLLLHPRAEIEAFAKSIIQAQSEEIVHMQYLLAGH